MPENDEKLDEVDLDITEDEVTTSDNEPNSEEGPNELELENAELLNRIQRLQAEFENYRKRIDSRFSEAAKFAGEAIILKVLDVYDNLERALDVDFEADPVAARNGVEAIQKQMNKILLSEGVKPIEVLGKEFDPYYQHAAHRINSPEKPDGTVVEVYQKGYMLKEKVLRPAVVCVNRHESHSNGHEDQDNQDSETKGE
jgi:molecular chaperone GrpE